MKPLVREDFQQWLDMNPDREFERASSQHCPLAEYFYDNLLESGEDKVSVCRDWIFIKTINDDLIHEYEAQFSPPIWAQCFITLFDRFTTYEEAIDDIPPRKKTGREAAMILRERC